MPYNPNQPRVPAGHDIGGEWTNDPMYISMRKGAGLPVHEISEHGKIGSPYNPVKVKSSMTQSQLFNISYVNGWGLSEVGFDTPELMIKQIEYERRIGGFKIKDPVFIKINNKIFISTRMEYRVVSDERDAYIKRLSG